jgi:hypothetical protein
MSMTNIPHEKRRAYLNTSYRLKRVECLIPPHSWKFLTKPDSLDFDQKEVLLLIGRRSDSLSRLFESVGVQSGAFITAFNPHGTLRSNIENDAAHALLGEKLIQLGVKSIMGLGGEDGTDWPVELSYFALGLSIEQARELGIFFEQDAVVWVGGDVIPRLILLR